MVKKYTTKSRSKLRCRKNKIKRFLNFLIFAFTIYFFVVISNYFINFSTQNDDAKTKKTFKLVNTSTQTNAPTEETEQKNNETSDKINKYPDKIQELLERNPETIDFVENYEKLGGIKISSNKVDILKDYTEGEIPLFIQWDKRWGYNTYGNEGIIAIDGCGPVCLSMVAVGVTGNLEWNPIRVSEYSEKEGYIDKESGSTSWELMSVGSKAIGLNPVELPLSENRVIEELLNGNPIICSMRPGDFTAIGHFIVLYGYKDGKILLHDPNSIIRSQQEWDYSKLEFQIKNLWAFSKA